MKRKIVGSYAHPEYLWIVETIRAGDIRSLSCGRCNMLAVLYRQQPKELQRRKNFVSTHAKCKERTRDPGQEG